MKYPYYFYENTVNLQTTALLASYFICLDPTALNMVN